MRVLMFISGALLLSAVTCQAAQLDQRHIDALIERYRDAVDRYEELFEPVRDEMSALGIDSWSGCVRGHIVRLGDIRNAPEGRRSLMVWEARDEGFRYLPALRRAMLVFDLNRETWPTLDAYFPKLVAAMGTPAPVAFDIEPFTACTRFAVAGPFPLDWDGDPTPPQTQPGLDRVYGPEETGYDADAIYETVDGESGWEIVATEPSRRGLLDLRRHFETTDNVVAYAFAQLVTRKATSALLSMGANDGVRAWLNGEVVLDAPKGGGASPDEHQLQLQLQAGANDLLFKVANLGANWQLYALLFESEGIVEFATPEEVER